MIPSSILHDLRGSDSTLNRDFMMTEDCTFPASDCSSPLRIYFFSDTHLQAHHPGNPLLSKTWRRHPSPALPVSSEALLRSHLERAVNGGADLILCGGDLCHFPSPENKELASRLFTECPLPVLSVPGNHDSFYPGQQGGCELHNQQLSLLHPLFGPQPAFWKHEQNGVRILGVDNSQYFFSREQLEFLEQELDSPQSTLMMMHVPLDSPQLRKAAIAKHGHPMLMEDPEISFPENIDPEPTNAALSLIRNSRQLLALLTAHVHIPFMENVTPHLPQLLSDAGYRNGFRWISVRPEK